MELTPSLLKIIDSIVEDACKSLEDKTPDEGMYLAWEEIPVVDGKGCYNGHSFMIPHLLS